MRHRIVSTNGIRVHCVEEGDGPLVLLVHGFPESWYSWRHQLPALAAAGYRAVAIDVRGYGRSSCPRAVEDYRMVKMVGDVVGLLPALGASRACLVGHDWGAPIVLELGAAAARPVLGRRRFERAVHAARRRHRRSRRCASGSAKPKSSTSSTSSSPGAPRPRSRRTCGAGCSASTGARRATCRGRRRTSR